MSQLIQLSKIKPNPDNPRIIKDDKFKKLVQSLKDFPEMAEVREIVVNKDMVILGGNMRFKAMQEAGWSEAQVKIVDWPIEKQREFIIKDNVSGGEWDWEALANEWDNDELDSWSLINIGDSSKLNTVNAGDENDEWVGMPEFESSNEALKIIINFETEEDRENYATDMQLQIATKGSKTWSTWYPYKAKENYKSMKYE